MPASSSSRSVSSDTVCSCSITSRRRVLAGRVADVGQADVEQAGEVVVGGAQQAELVGDGAEVRLVGRCGAAFAHGVDTPLVSVDREERSGFACGDCTALCPFYWYASIILDAVASFA